MIQCNEILLRLYLPGIPANHLSKCNSFHWLCLELNFCEVILLGIDQEMHNDVFSVSLILEHVYQARRRGLQWRLTPRGMP